MSLKKAVDAISQINARNGYAYYPTEVSVTATNKLQGVTVTCGEDDGVVVDINADGVCYERIREHIHAVLDGRVVFVEKSAQITESDDATA